MLRVCTLLKTAVGARFAKSLDARLFELEALEALESVLCLRLLLPDKRPMQPSYQSHWVSALNPPLGKVRGVSYADDFYQLPKWKSGSHSLSLCRTLTCRSGTLSLMSHKSLSGHSWRSTGLEKVIGRRASFVLLGPSVICRFNEIKAGTDLLWAVL